MCLLRSLSGQRPLASSFGTVRHCSTLPLACIVMWMCYREEQGQRLEELAERAGRLEAQQAALEQGWVALDADRAALQDEHRQLQVRQAPKCLGNRSRVFKRRIITAQ